MERLLHELIVNQPDDPLSFLVGVLSTPVVPKVMLCSPPAGGKATQSRMLVEKCNLVRISSSELLRTERHSRREASGAVNDDIVELK
ncbi:Adenylate kinase 2 [Diplonema papillatum]|nr:Adenylate kinase 2 [Diplonema papillatum]